MEKETEIVFRCPFCMAEIWFNRKCDLEMHLYREHLRDVLEAFSKFHKFEVRKVVSKWMIH